MNFKKKEKVILFFVIGILFLTFITAIELDVGGSLEEPISNFNEVRFTTPDPRINATTTDLTFNKSDFWITDQGNMDNVPDLYLTLDLRYLQSFTESDPFSLHLNQDNWFNDSNDWITWETSNTITFNELKLETTYYNATQSQAVKGTIDGGTLVDTQHPDGNYDGITFNFTEESGSPGLDLRINFTGVDGFNRGIIRYTTSDLSGDFPIIQLWDYSDLNWEDSPTLAENDGGFVTITQPVFDDDGHIGGEDGTTVQMRLYKSSNGNTQNHYYIDWIAISKGYGTPSGQEVDPFFEAWLNNPVLENNLNMSGYNITADTYFGNTLKVDHIAEKTAWHNVVFDNQITAPIVITNTIGGTISELSLSVYDGIDSIGRLKFEGIADDTFRFAPTPYRISIDLGQDELFPPSQPTFRNLWLSGDANIGGDALVDGGVNATYFNGTFYGDGSRLIGITGVNASFNQTFTDSLYSTQSQLLILLANESIVGCGLNMQMGDLKWSNNSLETVCWKVANGTAGTTDLRQQQLLSASALFAQGSSGGSYQGLGTHSHSLSAYGSGLQNSGIGQYVGGGMWGYGSTVYVTGTTDSAQSPPYYTQYLKQCMCDGLI